MALVLGTFASCVKEGPMGPQGVMGPMGPQGPQGQPGAGSSYDIVTLEVPQEAWQYTDNPDGLNNCFKAVIPTEKLTREKLDGGIFNVYRLLDLNTSDPKQQILPYTRYYEQPLTNGEIAFYSETIDYEVGLGCVYVYYTLSDFYYEEDLTFVPAPMKFRLVIVY